MATGDPPTPLTRKHSLADISPDIQDLGPALTPSQSYSDAGIDTALANISHSQAAAINSLLASPFARVEGNLPTETDSRPPSPKRARPTIILPTDPPLGTDDSGSEHS